MNAYQSNPRQNLNAQKLGLQRLRQTEKMFPKLNRWRQLDLYKVQPSWHFDQ